VLAQVQVQVLVLVRVRAQALNPFFSLQLTMKKPALLLLQVQLR
jgi:hypothetical protein